MLYRHLSSRMRGAISLALLAALNVDMTRLFLKVAGHPTAHTHFHMTGFWCEEECCATHPACSPSEAIILNGTRGRECLTSLSDDCTVWIKEYWNLDETDVFHSEWQAFIRVPMLYGTWLRVPPNFPSPQDYNTSQDRSAVNLTRYDYGANPLNMNCNQVWVVGYEDPEGAAYGPSVEYLHNTSKVLRPTVDSVVPGDDTFAKANWLVDGDTGSSPFMTLFDENCPIGSDGLPLSPCEEDWDGRLVGNHSVIVIGGYEWERISLDIDTGKWSHQNPKASDCVIDDYAMAATITVWRKYPGANVWLNTTDEPKEDEEWPDWQTSWEHDERPALSNDYYRRLLAIDLPERQRAQGIVATNRKQLAPSLRGARPYQLARRLLDDLADGMTLPLLPLML